MILYKNVPQSIDKFQILPAKRYIRSQGVQCIKSNHYRVWICMNLNLFSVPKYVLNCELLQASLVFALWAFPIRVRHGMDLSWGSKWVPSDWDCCGGVVLWICHHFFWIIILESYIASRPMSYMSYIYIKNLKLAQGWIGTVPHFPGPIIRPRGLHHCLHQPMEGTHWTLINQDCSENPPISCYVSCWAWRASIAFVDSWEGNLHLLQSWYKKLKNKHCEVSNSSKEQSMVAKSC